MKPDNDTHRNSADLSASEWFVKLDADSVDRATHDAFVEWLKKNPQHETDFEQCEALLGLTSKLKDDSDLAWAFRESAEIAAGTVSPAGTRRATPWFLQPKVGIAVAGLALVVVAAVFTRMNADDAAEIAQPPAVQMADTPAAIEDVIGPEVVVLPVQTAPPQPPEATQLNARIIVNDDTDFADASSYGALDVQIEALQAELDNLRLTYTDRHPRIRMISEMLDDLIRQRERLADSQLRIEGFRQADGTREQLITNGEMRFTFFDTQTPEALPIANRGANAVNSAEQVQVQGAVRAPGFVPYREGMTLHEVISEAGGLTDLAAGNRSQLLRTVNGEEVGTPLRLDELAIEGDLFEITPIRPGDIIVVPEEALSR